MIVDEYEILNTVTVRAEEGMTLADLKVRCGQLPTGTLVTLQKDFNIYRWQEIGMARVDSSHSTLEYITADGEEGMLEVGTWNAPISPQNSPLGSLGGSGEGRFKFANQLEVTKSGKKIWWRVYELGTIEAGTTLMLLGHMVYPWHEGGVTLDRWIQVWQPVVPSKVGARHGPFAWNFFVGNCDFKVRGNLGFEPLAWSQNGRKGLQMRIANKTELKFDQPLEVKRTIERLSTNE